MCGPTAVLRHSSPRRNPRSSKLRRLYSKKSRPRRRFRRQDQPIQIHGNTIGLKASSVKALERLGRRRVSADSLVTNELARSMTELSAEIRRQVGVLVDRQGVVQHVMVGSRSSTELPDWGRLRAGRGRLRGLRLIHTHLAGEGLTRDDETDLALRQSAQVALETITGKDYGLDTAKWVNWADSQI